MCAHNRLSFSWMFICYGKYPFQRTPSNLKHPLVIMTNTTHTHILVHATSERSYQQGPLLAQVQPTEATGCHHCWYSPFIGGPHKYVWVAYKLHTKKISYSLPIGNYPHVDSSSSTSGPSSLWLPGSNEPTTKLEIFLTLQFWCPPINSRK